MADELFELSSGLFTGDEIDDMDKIRRTLKEVRLEEQRWKQRTNRLLDMKEEAEALLEDL